MKARNVWLKDGERYDMEIDKQMRSEIMDLLVKKAMNALSKSFNNEPEYIYEAYECLQSWVNLNEPSDLRTDKWEKEEEPTDQALQK